MLSFYSFILTFMTFCLAQAALHTDTHTYILSEKEERVLVINKATGVENSLIVGRNPSKMVIHGQFGYVVNSCSNTISVIDLRVNAVTQTIPVGGSPHSMLIYNDMGYVSNSDTVSCIDLKTNSVVQVFPTGTYPRPMVIHGDFGYIINTNSASVLVLNLKTNTLTQTIPVGNRPKSMAIHSDFGYVVNKGSNTVSVIDLKSHTVTKTIAVGDMPFYIVIHKDHAYVQNMNSCTVSVINLVNNQVINTIRIGSTHLPMHIFRDTVYVENYDAERIVVLDLNLKRVSKVIPVKEYPHSMIIHGNFGYVKSLFPSMYRIIHLKTNTVVGDLENPGELEIDFSDTHVYLGIRKLGPLCPTVDGICKMREANAFNEFVRMKPEIFNVGVVEPRLLPVEETPFDEMPNYLLAFMFCTDGLCWDPKDILATLITMKYPQRFLKSEAARYVRKWLYAGFFQTVWLGKKEKAQEMLKYFIQLKDPIISNLATYTLGYQTPQGVQRIVQSSYGVSTRGTKRVKKN